MRAPFLPLLALIPALLAGPGAGCAPADEPLPAAAPHAPRHPERVAPKTIDLAICLDTSGSMQGLIDAARQKLWSLVSELAMAKPTPSLRVALLTFGSPGSDDPGHVVLRTDFTQDLDLVSEKLFQLGTNGGDEFVGRVLHRALGSLAWTTERSLRLVFVAGNESADQDREKPFRLEAQNAVARGVIVNAIYCGGPDDGDAALWRELALLGKGRFASIDHNQGTVAIATPFDQPLAELSAKLNATYVFVGNKAREQEERQRAQDGNAAGAGAPAAAERAAAKASGLYKTDDLVERLAADPTLDLATLKDEELPEDMQKVPAAERKAWLEARKTEREALQTQVKELDHKRRAHVETEMKRQQLSDTNGLDRALKNAVREQAGAAGFDFSTPAR